MHGCVLSGQAGHLNDFMCMRLHSDAARGAVERPSSIYKSMMLCDLPPGSNCASINSTLPSRPKVVNPVYVSLWHLSVAPMYCTKSRELAQSERNNGEARHHMYIQDPQKPPRKVQKKGSDCCIDLS
eukprot:3188983-Amphidinium_carterae.2